MALGFWESRHGQDRTMAISMMQALAPAHEGARGFVAGAKDTAGLLVDEAKPGVPDYSAIGEVIKMWMREHRQQRKNGR
jgi:hypothetical protein